MQNSEEDLAEHVLNVEPACETPERVTGLAQMLCGDFRVVANIGAGKKLIEGASARSISCRCRARVMSGVSLPPKLSTANRTSAVLRTSSPSPVFAEMRSVS